MISNDSMAFMAGRGRLVNRQNDTISRNGGYDFVYDFDRVCEVIRVGISLCHPHDFYNKRAGSAHAIDNLFAECCNSICYTQIPFSVFIERAVNAASRFIDWDYDGLSIYDVDGSVINDMIHDYVCEIYVDRFTQYLPKDTDGIKRVSYIKE